MEMLSAFVARVGPAALAALIAATVAACLGASVTTAVANSPVNFFRLDAARAPCHRPAVPLSPLQSSLADILCRAAPAGAIGYILRRQGCPLGNGVFDFPVPTRKTKRHDGSLTNTTTYRLWPFEPPRVPWPGAYELLYWVPNHGLLPSENPQRREIHLAKGSTVPRAAFDREALWRWEPLDDTDADSAEALQREVLARKPDGAIGYVLSSSSSPQGPGRFLFPPKGRVSRRANLGVSNVPYYSLDPFELPSVPWAGMFVLAYELGAGVVWLDPDPSRRLLRVGIVFPYADYDRPAPASTALLLPTGAPGIGSRCATHAAPGSTQALIHKVMNRPGRAVCGRLGADGLAGARNHEDRATEPRGLMVGKVGGLVAMGWGCCFRGDPQIPR